MNSEGNSTAKTFAAKECIENTGYNFQVSGGDMRSAAIPKLTWSFVRETD